MASSDRDFSFLALLDPDRRTALADLAASRGRTPSALLDDAVDAFLDTDRRWIAEIDAALGEAESGDFAGDDEVAAAFAPR